MASLVRCLHRAPPPSPSLHHTFNPFLQNNIFRARLFHSCIPGIYKSPKRSQTLIHSQRRSYMPSEWWVHIPEDAIQRAQKQYPQLSKHAHRVIAQYEGKIAPEIDVQSEAFKKLMESSEEAYMDHLREEANAGIVRKVARAINFYANRATDKIDISWMVPKTTDRPPLTLRELFSWQKFKERPGDVVKMLSLFGVCGYIVFIPILDIAEGFIFGRTVWHLLWFIPAIWYMLFEFYLPLLLFTSQYTSQAANMNYLFKPTPIPLEYEKYDQYQRMKKEAALPDEVFDLFNRRYAERFFPIDPHKYNMHKHGKPWPRPDHSGFPIIPDLSYAEYTLAQMRQVCMTEEEMLAVAEEELALIDELIDEFKVYEAEFEAKKLEHFRSEIEAQIEKVSRYTLEGRKTDAGAA